MLKIKLIVSIKLLSNNQKNGLVFIHHAAPDIQYKNISDHNSHNKSNSLLIPNINFKLKKKVEPVFQKLMWKETY